MRLMMVRVLRVIQVLPIEMILKTPVANPITGHKSG
eukprot:gene36913-48159_t